MKFFLYLFVLLGIGVNVNAEGFVEITTAEQLAGVQGGEGKYRLAADIDLSGVEWIAIGCEDSPFRGVFDGGGFEISGLRGEGGLFGVICGGSVKNIILRDCVVYTEDATPVGVFAGRVTGGSRVENCTVGGEVTGVIAGGFAGKICGGSRIEFSTARCDVWGDEVAGGFIGIISDDGAPNTITSSRALGCVVAGAEGAKVRRFAGLSEHKGVNVGYSYLGMLVLEGGRQLSVLSNPFACDGMDIRR